MFPIFVDSDVQRDFCQPDGALVVPGAPNEAFRLLTRHAVEHRVPIVGAVDSHAFDAWEFASNDHVGPGGQQPGFPDHCVKGTWGWLKVEGTLPERFRFVPNVPALDLSAVVTELLAGDCQGVYFEKEVYSVFANPLAAGFLAELRSAVSDELCCYLYGVATDYCVKAAALGLLERGYRTHLITDAVAGITPAGVAQALDEMRAAGVQLTTLAQVVGG